MKQNTLVRKPEQGTALAETRPLVRAEVIAKHLDCSKRCVLLWAQHDQIPHRRINGIVRFDLDEVLAALGGVKP